VDEHEPGLRRFDGYRLVLRDVRCRLHIPARGHAFFWANSLPVKLGGEELYLMGLRETMGALFSGRESYRLRVYPSTSSGR